MTNPKYYHFSSLGIILCQYHKEKRLQENPNLIYETIEPGMDLLTEWCDECLNVIVKYEWEVD